VEVVRVRRFGFALLHRGGGVDHLLAADLKVGERELLP
jgi:hypothetical protein